MSNNIPIAINRIAQNMYKHPIKTYFRGCSLGFGFTFLSNLFVGTINTNAPLSPYSNPHLFATSLVFKSVQHGILFPAIPFSIISSPKHYFVLGSGCEDLSKME